MTAPIKIFAGTNRMPHDSDSLFSAARSRDLQWVELGVTEKPRDKTLDFATSYIPSATNLLQGQAFTATTAQRFDDAAAFTEALKAQNSRSAVVFVHGFNTDFVAGLNVFAKAIKDFNLDVTHLYFSWPSAGDVTKYVHDRDSVLCSRDKLVAYLEAVIAAEFDTLILVAHSMGCFMMMEALRQLSLSGGADRLAQVARVGLISPDIDRDVFAAQMAQTDLPQAKFFISTSEKDQALAASSALTGYPRLGALPTLDGLGLDEVELINLSDVKDGDALNHLTALSSPTARALVAALKEEFGL